MGYEFNHVHLKSPDPRKTAEWYATAFDFTIMSDIVRPNGDQFVVTRTPDGVTVNISGARTDEELDEGNADVHWGLEHIGITIDDLDAELERLTGMGAVLKQALKAAGATRADVTKITAFLVNPEDYPAYAEARLDFFGNPGPASSTVFISGLVSPGYLVEIEAIAVL